MSPSPAIPRSDDSHAQACGNRDIPTKIRNKNCHGQKPHLIKSGRCLCDTENHVPIFVPGLSTGPSSSTTSTSSTSLSQELPVEDSTPSPASTRSRSTRSQALGGTSCMTPSIQHWDSGRVICPNGWMNSLNLGGRGSFSIKQCTRKHFS